MQTTRSTQNSINNIDGYFQLFKDWDNDAKKHLAIKLMQSINLSEKPSKVNTKADNISGFGAWQDDRTPDEIADDIRASRISNREIATLQ